MKHVEIKIHLLKMLYMMTATLTACFFIGCGSNPSNQNENAPKDQSSSKKLINHEHTTVQTAEILTNSIGMKFKPLTAGGFTMRRDGVTRQVTLTNSFEMGIHEVTQAQYEKIIGNNPSIFKGAQYPVETVSWEEAVEFCRKLSELPAEKAAGYVYRLPTEAEWEYTCRAGSTTKFSFGDVASLPSEYGWYRKNSSGKTHPVGQKKPNNWGLYDMHGNVWEWCQDFYGGKLSSDPVTDPTGPESGLNCVTRGGGWRVTDRRWQSSVILFSKPASRGNFLGFRVTRGRSSQARKSSE